MRELAAFLGVSALVIVTPGQDTALTIRNTLAGGRVAGVLTAVGVSVGQAVWTVATSVGIGTSLLPQFASSFAGLLVLGLVFCAMTLVWLAVYCVVVTKAGAVLRRVRVRLATEHR